MPEQMQRVGETSHSTVNKHPDDPAVFCHFEGDDQLVYHFRSVLFTNPVDALLWRKQVYMRAAANIDAAILDHLVRK
jgi:hypothetical protein